LALDSAEAAEEPFAIDEGIDEHALFGCGRTEALVVIVGELFELRDGFAGDGLGSGVDACLRAFLEERASPSTERGPVDFCGAPG
jgi:hypothetical protein